MQTIWKGAISFGLVHIPVKMHSATSDNDIHFRTLHKACSTPISQMRYCSNCDVQVNGVLLDKIVTKFPQYDMI